MSKVGPLNREFAEHLGAIGGLTRRFESPQPIPADEFLFRAFRDGAGNPNMAVDGSVTPVSFNVTVPANELWLVSRFGLHMIDPDIEFENFAGLGAPLSNGILFHVMDDKGNVALDFLDGLPIVRTLGFAHLSPDGVEFAQNKQGAGLNDSISVRWSLVRTGYSLWLPAGYSVRITVRDNLSPVDHFNAVAQGRRLSWPPAQ
jgi:hypothetical protein